MDSCSVQQRSVPGVAGFMKHVYDIAFEIYSTEGRSIGIKHTARNQSNSMKSKGNDPVCSMDLAAIILLLLLSSVYFFTAATTENYGSDTSTYFALSESIRNGDGYQFNFQPHTIYPPGFPLLLAGLMNLVGVSFANLVKCTVAIGFIGIAGVYLLVRIRRGPLVALAITTLVSTSAVFYFWTTVGLHSDVPYFTASIYAILLIEIGSRSTRRWVSVLSSLLASLLVSYLVLLRSIGTTFVMGTILWLINPIRTATNISGDSPTGRLRKWFPVALLPIVVFLAWSYWCNQNRILVLGGNYMDSYSSQILKEDPHQIDSPNITVWKIPERIVTMGVIRTSNAIKTIFNSPSITVRWNNPVFFLFLIVMVTGFFHSILKEGSISEYYVVSYMGLLLLYPFDEGTRYLFSIQPFLYLYGMTGMEVLFEYGQAEKTRKYYPVAIAACGFIISFLFISIYLQGSLTKTAILSIIFWFFVSLFSLYMYFRCPGRSQETETIKSSFPLQKHAGRILPSVKVLLLVCITTAGIYQIHLLAKKNMNPVPSTFINYPTVEASNWISEHTKKSSVIMHDQYQILHRLTNRKTVRFPLTTNHKLLMDKIRANNVNYIIVLHEKKYEYYNPSTMKRFEILSKAYPNVFEKVYTFDKGTIYSVDLPFAPDISIH